MIGGRHVAEVEALLQQSFSSAQLAALAMKLAVIADQHEVFAERLATTIEAAPPALALASKPKKTLSMSENAVRLRKLRRERTNTTNEQTNAFDPANERTNERTNAETNANERTNEQANSGVGERGPSKGPPAPPTDPERTNERTNEQPNERTNEQPNELPQEKRPHLSGCLTPVAAVVLGPPKKREIDEVRERIPGLIGDDGTNAWYAQYRAEVVSDLGQPKGDQLDRFTYEALRDDVGDPKFLPIHVQILSLRDLHKRPIARTVEGPDGFGPSLREVKRQQEEAAEVPPDPDRFEPGYKRVRAAIATGRSEP